MRKLVCESLEELNEGKRSEYAHKAEEKLSTGKPVKLGLDKNAKAKEAIQALKAELADVKKAGKMKDSTAGKNAKIAEIQAKIDKWQSKIKESYSLDEATDQLNEGAINNALIATGAKQPKELDDYKFFIIFSTPKLAEKPIFLKALNAASIEDLQAAYTKYQSLKKTNKKPVFGLVNGKVAAGSVNVNKAATGSNA